MAVAIAEDGARLAYEVGGAGPPLLLIAGQAQDRRLWDHMRPHLEAHHRVIVYDHRGVGASDRPEDAPYTTRGFAGDAVAVLDAAGIARAHVHGFSMGGRIAQWLAIDHAARVAGLVLGATTPGNAHGVRRPPAVDPELASGDPVRLLPYMVSPAWARAHAAWLRAQASVVPASLRRLHFAASEAHDAWDRLPEIAAPTLIVHGTDDQVNVPANAERLAARIPGAQLSWIAGARHAYVWEQAEVASARICAFLATG